MMSHENKELILSILVSLEYRVKVLVLEVHLRNGGGWRGGGGGLKG